MKAVVPAGPGKVELTEVTEVEPRPDEMVIEVGVYAASPSWPGGPARR